MKAYRKIQTTNIDVNRLQSQIEQVINPVLRTTLINGVLIKDVAITTAGATIEHKLGRQPQGWMITDKQGNTDIWRTAWSEKFLTLDASGSTTFSVWVF